MRSGPSLVQWIVVAVVVGGLALLFWPSGEEPAPDEAVENVGGVDSIRARLAGAGRPRNPIERARLATFQLVRGGSSGTAFLVDRQCHAVTNRHVVDTNFAGSQGGGEERRALERRLSVLIRALEREKDAARRRCPDCFESDLDDLFAPQQLAIDRMREQIDLGGSGGGDGRLHAVLADGSEVAVMVVWQSDSLDAAVVRLQGSDCPFLESAPDSNLEFGEKLFAVGNPLGLTHSVSSGVFSGYRDVGSGRIIQTDTPINPGNSGGPLLLEDGRVVGINTMIAAGADGIGFAIPVSRVLAEWSP